MAVQIDTDELKGCKSYFLWIADKIQPVKENQEGSRWDIPESLCRLMLSTDYFYEMEEDGIRAKDAVDLRKIYAEEVGKKAGKNERETDRIWKSVHGKCSVLELIFSLCVRLDEMVNEGEEGAMVPDFFRILCGNIGFNTGKDAEKVSHEDSQQYWKADLCRMMERKYEADGSGGGLFPLKKWSENSSKDQRKVSIWYQMNTWLDENLDENEHFMIKKSAEK